MRDIAHQDPDLIQPETLPVAAEPVGERVDAQAVVRRREGSDVPGEERRTEDGEWFWRSIKKEIGSCRGASHAVFVRVSRAVVQFELKLSRCCHTEEGDTSVR